MSDDSIFNAAQPNNAADSNTDDISEGDVNYLDRFVGEGKKYATNEDLAKAYEHSLKFIDQLKGETSGLRTELGSRQALEELVTKLQETSQRANTDASNQNHNHSDDERPDGTTRGSVYQESDILALIQKTLNEEQTRNQTEANRRLVQSELQKAWGPGYVDQLRRTAQTMGVDEASLDHLAKTSPQLFLNAVLGADRPKTNSSDLNTNVPPRSQVNTQASDMRSGSAVEREWAQLNGLMKTNPTQYWSPTVQNRLMKLMEQRMRDAGAL